MAVINGHRWISVLVQLLGIAVLTLAKGTSGNGNANSNGVGDSNSGTSQQSSTPAVSPSMIWRTTVATHLCPLIKCADWCDCTEAGPDVTFGKEEIEKVSQECLNKAKTDEGVFDRYTDCLAEIIIDRAYFKWKPIGPGIPPSCTPAINNVVYLTRVNESSRLVNESKTSFHWLIYLEDGNPLNISELCGDETPAIDSCHLCASYSHDSTSATTSWESGQSGNPNQTSIAGENNGKGSPGTSGNYTVSDYNVVIFGAGVGAGVVGAVIIFVVILLCIFYVRRKRKRSRQLNQPNISSVNQYDSNPYQTIDDQYAVNGEARTGMTVFPTVSRQASFESGTSQSSSTHRYKMKKTTPSAKSAPSGSNNTGPYTEYYANRSKSCYSELQTVASDSALSAMEKSQPPANTALVSEYQEPDPVVPFIPGINDDRRLSHSNSFKSFKLTGEYVQPDVHRHSVDKSSLGSPGKGMSPDSTIARQFKQKGDDVTTSPTTSIWHGLKKGKRNKGATSASCKEKSSSSNTRPDSKEGNLYLELQEKLNRKKKCASESESTQVDMEGENPYAEVGDALLEPYPGDIRPRCYSQPSSSLPGYQTYEEIKPIPQPDPIGLTILDYNDSPCDDSNPYFVLEKEEDGPTYFELENANGDPSNQNKLEKPNSLPLDNKHQYGKSESGKYSPEQKIISLSDNSASKANGLKNDKRFDMFEDSNKVNNCANSKTNVYFQLEPGQRESTGSTKMDIPNDPANLAEGTQIFYPGGKQRASANSLGGEVYDHLNRSARSSREESTAMNPNSAYGSLTPSEEHSQQAKLPGTKTKSFRKK